MNFAIFLSGLRARFRMFIGIVSVTVIAAMVVSLLMPKTYIAMVAIKSDSRNEQSLNPQTNTYYNERERASYLQTQMDILTSQQVARQVVRDLHLAGRAEWREAYGKTEHASGLEDWLGQQLLAGLKVDTSQSSVIKLSYSANDPAEAARLANAFAQAYVGRVLALRVEPLKQASAWFDQQTNTLRANMEAARVRLVEFERQQGLLAANERDDLEVARLNELASLAVRTREPAGADSYVDAAVRNNGNIANLKGRLSTAKAELQELSSEFGSRHPRVIRQNAEVAALNAQLESEMRAASTVAVHSLQTTRQRSRNLEAEVATQRKRVGELREAHSRLRILRSDFENAQRVYDQARQRSIASEVDSRALVADVSVLSEAVPPDSAYRPQVATNVGLALVIGILLGLVAVYLLEASERRLRRIDELANDPVLPLLAVLNADDPPRLRLLPRHTPDISPGFQRAIAGPR